MWRKLTLALLCENSAFEEYPNQKISHTRSKPNHTKTKSYLHMLHLLALRRQLRQVGRLFAMMVHMDAQTRRVAHTFLADVALKRAFAGVVFVPDVHLQVVPVREVPVAGWTLHAPCFAVPTGWMRNYRSYSILVYFFQARLRKVVGSCKEWFILSIFIIY